MMKKILVGAAMATILAAGAGAASAQDEPLDDAASDAGGAARPPHGGPGRLAERLGLDRDELAAELEAGRTLAEIAADQGLDIDAVIESLVDEMEQRAEEDPDSRFARAFDRDRATERLRRMADRQLDPSDRPRRDRPADAGRCAAVPDAAVPDAAVPDAAVPGTSRPGTTEPTGGGADEPAAAGASAAV